MVFLTMYLTAFMVIAAIICVAVTAGVLAERFGRWLCRRIEARREEKGGKR